VLWFVRWLSIFGLLFIPSFAFADYTVTPATYSTGNLIDMSAANNTNGGQIFTTVGVGDVSRIDICLSSNIGSQTGDVTMDIYAASGNDPTGSSLGQATIVANTVSGAAALYTFTFGTPVSLSASTDYVAVIGRTDNSVGNVKGCGNAVEATNGVYSDDNAATWNALSAVFYMTVFVTEAGGGGTGTTTPQVFSTTTQLVDNPNQDFANGLWLFLAGAWFMVYLFAKKR